MIYPKDFENKIDFTSIKQALKNCCSFEIGKEKADEICFINDFNRITFLINSTQEMKSALLDASTNYPQCTMYDLRENLSRIRIEGLFMDEDELLRLKKAIEAVVAYNSFFENLDKNRFPLLSNFTQDKISADFQPKQILTDIDRIIDKYGRLKDNASQELMRIRHDLQQAQGSVQRTLQSILKQAQAQGLVDKDVSPTLREGRLVIPVSPANKRKIGGIVHDESATGKTVYIEPQQVVEANNRLRELESEEKRERAKILLDFTARIRPQTEYIKQSQVFLGEVDFLCAKAKYAININAIAPQIVNSTLIDWRQARHPLLEERLKKQDKAIVPLNIRLADKPQNKILIISGPNAGGKSVCLKTVALLQYMLQSGILIPVREDTTAGIYDNIFIDIGDEQSIEDDLSTYSSHLKNMKHFVRYSDHKTLLLIDEFGGGTEPKIGGAIAQAVLEKLGMSGATGLITTHYDNLKHFAQDNDGYINGAMLYDRQQLRPLFQLSIGQAGSSFAIEIAHQIGLPKDIIDKAKELAGDEHIEYEKHLQDIARDKRYWEQKREQIHQREKVLEEKIAIYEEKIGTVKDKRRQLLEQAQQEAQALLKKSNATIENTIRVIKESAADKEKTKEARKQLEQFKNKVDNAVAAPKQKTTAKKSTINKDKTKESTTPAITIGCKVKRKDDVLIGEVISLTAKQALVGFGGIQSFIPLKELEYVSARQAKKEQKNSATVYVPSNISDSLRKRKLAFTNELDIRGLRADEALTAVMNYIDDAVMVGAEQVRILHGTGTGALRQVVRNYLQMQPKVTTYHDAHPDEGGAGITIAVL